MKIIFINKLYSPWISDLEKAFRNAGFKEDTHFTTIPNIFRHEALVQTKTSEKVLEYLNHGKLVPNEFCCELIGNEINRVKKDRIVLWGFPRLNDQWKALQDYFPKADLYLIVVKISAEKVLKKIEAQFEYKNGTKDFVGKEKLLEKIEIEQSNFQQLKKLPEAIILKEEELVSRVIKILN